MGNGCNKRNNALVLRESRGRGAVKGNDTFVLRES